MHGAATEETHAAFDKVLTALEVGAARLLQHVGCHLPNKGIQPRLRLQPEAWVATGQCAETPGDLP